jgi:GNAT superfamily N-acetyltransferase
MSEAGIECRRAASQDWEQIWPILSAVVAGGDTYTYAPGIEEAEAKAAWMMEGATSAATKAATYVATIGGAVVATAHLKPNQPGLGDHVANAAWMVDPAAAGRGIGRVLGKYVIGEARRFGFRAMQFNAVVATNSRAISLWESLGFSIVGTVPRAFRHSTEGLVSVHVMYRDL